MIMITVIFCAIAPVSSVAADIYFTRTPELSPDAQKIVFSYEGDLWVTDVAGGTAYRLTGMEGNELFPRFSPDGKWIAFTGSQDGNGNVYVMPATGGEIKQLTFHDSNDAVDSWSWDSKTIYFNSSRYNNFTAFKVNREGGTPQRLIGNYFNTIHGVVEDPLSGALYFTDSWESLQFASRKRYKGDNNPDIKSYNPKTKEFKQYTTYRGKDFEPTIDQKGTLYFISDRFHDETNLFKLVGDKEVQLTSFDSSIRSPRVSANGEKVVFLMDYQMYIYSVAEQKTTPVSITLFRNDTLTLAQGFDVNGKITAYDVSPDGKKLAFVSRGELFVADVKGKFIRQIERTSTERVLEVLWLKDSKTVLFTQTLDGWLNLYKIRTDSKEKEVRLTTDSANNRNLNLDSQRKQVVYLSGTRHLKLMDLETFKSSTLCEDELWGLENSQPYFSPDDRWVVFTAYRNFEEDILVYNLETKKTLNVTDSGMSEMDPFWSPDGKYLYFSANRFIPNYPNGGEDTKIYRLPLQKFNGPFKSAKLAELYAEKETNTEKEDKKTDKKTDKKETAEDKNKYKTPANFDLTEIMNRWEQISPRSGTQGEPYVVADKEGDIVIYSSNHDGEKAGLWMTTQSPFEEPKTQKIKGAETTNPMISKANDTYYALVQGKIGQLDLKGATFTPIAMSYKFQRNLRAEFNQMFFELWAGLQENYYDADFHGSDWGKIKEKYQKYLPYVCTRSDLRLMINDMLGEVNSSHMGFGSRGDEEKTFHKVSSMATGVLFDENDPFLVKEVVVDSPADKKDIDIKPGDRLLAVNFKDVDPAMNREYYFAAPALAEELALTFKRLEQTFTVTIHPCKADELEPLLYDQWIRDNQRVVDQKGGNRIAYIYMKDMGRKALEQFIIEMTCEANQREALILDLRYNTGGNVHDAVLNFLGQRSYLLWKYRGGQYAPQPHFAPSSKPMVLLINEQSLSDAEMTAAGFKALKLGIIIGTETYRWIIFTSGKGLVDGSFYRLPSWGCYTLDKQDLELSGVAPDIHVQTTLKNRLDGEDPQLEMAIYAIIRQLDSKQ